MRCGRAREARAKVTATIGKVSKIEMVTFTGKKVSQRCTILTLLILPGSSHGTAAPRSHRVSSKCRALPEAGLRPMRALSSTAPS